MLNVVWYKLFRPEDATLKVKHVDTNIKYKIKYNYKKIGYKGFTFKTLDVTEYVIDQTCALNDDLILKLRPFYLCHVHFGTFFIFLYSF